MPRERNNQNTRPRDLQQDPQQEIRQAVDQENRQQAAGDAFNGGRYGGENNPDSPFNYQPTPRAMWDYAAGNTAGSQPAAGEQPGTPSGRAPVGVDQVRMAYEILRKYKQGKQNLEDKLIKNEKWWRMRHWELMATEENREDPKPASGWLFNVIISKHADYMDNFPDTNILPREPGDVEEAQRLSSIVPVVMDQCGYRQQYSDANWKKCIGGTGAYSVFWDATKLNGLGDISINAMDLLSMYWEPGVKDIQDSKHFFTVELVDNDVLTARYPNLANNLATTNDPIVKKYQYDDHIDTTGKSAVIDWYYHKMVGNKKTLQYVKFTGETVLYATENIPEMAERGLYDHGQYPFVFDPLFPILDMPYGFGFVDVCKNSQASIDIFNNCFEKNAQYACAPRYLARNDGGINEEEFADPNQLIVHVDGNLGDDSYKTIDPPGMINGNYISLLDQKINEMKETAGNRDAVNGGTSAGVTAASAIAAMQESAGKTSRDQIATTFDAHKKVVYFVVELIRQFYDMPRQFRITGQDGQQEFTEYSNAGLQPQYQGMEYGIDMGYRLPAFDIKVEAEKSSAYSRLSQNELALQFYGSGFFAPQNSDQALTCLSMMNFQGKQEIIQRIQNNGTMYQQMLQLQQQMLQMAQMIDQLSGGQTQMAASVADQINMALDSGQPMGGIAQMPQQLDNSTGIAGESSHMTNARERAADTTTPT